MAIGRAKSMGIREAFYMTFSYKEIRLCLAIGKPVSIATGYGVQDRQDGRPKTVGAGRSAASAWRQSVSSQQPASIGQVWRSGTAIRYGDKAPFVPHLFCAAARFLPTDRRFPKCPLTSHKLSTGANRGLSHLAVDKAVSSV